MISPGSKGWILKYIDLVDKNEINIDFNSLPSDKNHQKHIVFSQTGIIFGFPSELIFAKNTDQTRWTLDEKLTFLLFESHLYNYLSNGGSKEKIKTEFIDSMLDFYEHHSVISFTKVFTFFLKESADEKLEKILEKELKFVKIYLKMRFG